MDKKWKKRLRRLGISLFRMFLGLLAGLLTYWLLAVLLGSIAVNTDWEESEQGVDVFLRTNGVHVDLVLPLNNAQWDWRQLVPASDFMSAPAQYVSFGWGDQGFYLETPNWSDLKASVALKAIFWPSTTALHVTYLNDRPLVNEHSRKIRLSPSEYEALVQYIANSFVQTNGRVQRIDCCQYPGWNDNFYAAQGAYHLLNTCNEWANQGLKTAGVRVPVWSPFDWTLMNFFED